jgi:hypothetical protein
MVSFLTGLGTGALLGWVILKRPQWVEDLIAKIKAKLGM